MPPIPTNLVTGFLGVGKTTAVIDLLKHKDSAERWAVLVNEYGEVGIDGALIEGTRPDGVTVQEVAGGCVCCASAPYLPVALHFLLLDARPDRLIIETTGLGHPARLLDTLRENYRDRLEIRAVLGLVDPADFAKPEMRDNPVFIDQIQLADVVVMNKLDTATPELVAAFQQWANGLFPPKLLIAGTTQGRLDPKWLDLQANDERLPLYPEAHEHLVAESGRTPSPTSGSASPAGRGGRGVRATPGGKHGEEESQRHSERAGRQRHIPEELLQRARELRREQTSAEQFLWDCLRDRQLLNANFRRQHNVGPYIADFYCHESRLCIELDAAVHDTTEQVQNDQVRNSWLREQGFMVLRFRNDAVFGDPKGVLEAIAEALTRHPLPAGEGEEDVSRGFGDGPRYKRYPSPPDVHPACCGWVFTPDEVFEEGKLLVLLGQTPEVTRLKGVFRLVDEWAVVNRAGTAVHVAPTAYRRESRLEVFGEGLDWLAFERALLDCLLHS